MWSSAKSLKCIVSDVICNGKANRLLEMENALQKHKQLLFSPLSFPGKCEGDYQAVKTAQNAGVFLPEFPHRVLLSEDIIQESLFLSEVFRLNELRAVELCLTVESQLSSFPHLARSLVGVILYYESHLSIIESLVTLIGARDGRMWSTSATPEICQSVHKFTDDLFASGALQNILGTLRSFSAYEEFSRLETAQVLGDSKHRHDVFMLLKNISEGLAECLMLWSCQSVLNLSEFKLVLDCLLTPKPQALPVNPNENKGQLIFQINSQLTREGVHLYMALLYCFQPFSSNTICADQLSDLTDFDLFHPLYTDRSFASGIGRLLDEKKALYENHTNEDRSEKLQLLALIRLSWAICLRRTSHLRAELRRRRSADVNSSTNCKDDFGIGGDEADELQAALAIESGALEFARKQILNTADFEREPLWVYRMHCIITDLIVHMPARIKDIRLRDEDLLRSTGFDPSTTGHGFANLLLLIAQLYNQPGSRLHSRLALEYWWPVGELANITPAVLGSNDYLSTGMARKSPRPKLIIYGAQSRNAEVDNIRQAALIRFLRLAGDMVTTPCLFLPYLRMLHSLCCSRSAAGLCFSLLKANASNPGRGASLITWDHFFNSFRQYLNHMKQTVVQPESTTNLRVQPSNQLYPHIYFNDGIGGGSRTTRGAGLSRPTAESMYGSRRGVGAMELSTTTATTPTTSQPRAIQPEEQAGLQAVLRLVARICRMDPVARSAFISNPQWQLLPVCMGFLTCSVSLDLKADVLYLLTELCKSQQNIPLLWQYFVSAELLPFNLQRAIGQPQSSVHGLNTDMDEVEPRAEEYPLTNAFLSLMTVILPKLINYPIVSSNVLKSTDAKDTMITAYDGNMIQVNPFVSITSFITNTIFLRHTMRAYRNPMERWDIAASCLVLFDGLVNDFLNRLNNAIVVITTLMMTSREKDGENLDSLFASSGVGGDVNAGNHQSASGIISQSVDWPSYLLNILFQMGKEQQHIHGHQMYSTTMKTTTATATTSEALISQLHLPAGWPYTDPGYHLATQLLTDSSLFRMVTGLLEVGLHRHLEFPLPNGPPAGMTRATYAGLSLIRRLLASEDILVTFVRRIATNIQPRIGSGYIASSNVSIPLPNLPSFGHTVLPVYVSRLLMSTNSGSGKADLIPMLLKYCLLADYLPDHTACAVNILGYLAASIKPHTDLLALLTSDEKTRNQLLGAFAHLIQWPTNNATINSTFSQSLDDQSSMLHYLDNDGHFAFTDEWLYGDSDNELALLLHTVGTFSARLPSPASCAARLDAAFPIQTTNWYFPNQAWERWTTYMPYTYFSNWSDIRITHNRIINSDYYSTAFGDWFYQITSNSSSVPISISFHQILLAVMDHPAPNLVHWLCGFRFDSCKAISRSNLQDAGIADQQRTCLHSMLDVLDTTSHWLQSTSSLPYEFACTLHWNTALIWQILYKLGFDSLTSEPFLRFLRSNHDLFGKYLLSDVCQSSFSSSNSGNICEGFTPRQKAVLEALSLNRKNWILRLYAIELRVCAIANQRSHVTKLLKLFFGDLLFDNSFRRKEQPEESPSVLIDFIPLLNASEEFISESNPLESKMFDPNFIHELLAKSEVACPLVTSDSNAARCLSRMIHFKIFLMNLYIKLVGLRNDLDNYTNDDLNKLLMLTFEQVFDINVSAHHLASLEVFNCTSAAAATTTTSATIPMLIKQISAVREWIDTRNVHGLLLYAGKQAAIEGWRQAVEISLGLMTDQLGYGGAGTKQISGGQSFSSVSSYLYSELMSSQKRDVGSINNSSSNVLDSKLQLRPMPALCMDVLILLLSEICSIKEVPQTIRLLASGTTLSLCSFLHGQSAVISAKSNSSLLDSTGITKCTYNRQWSPLLILIMELIIKSIVRTKTSTQRMRANYYGSLCYMIRFCRSLSQLEKEDTTTISDCKSLAECFSVFSPSSSSVASSMPDTLHSDKMSDSDLSQLHSLLMTDLIHGHTITQMAAMSLLELLISFDRCSHQLISQIDSQGTIDHLLETIDDDLNAITKFLTPTDARIHDDPQLNKQLPVDVNDKSTPNTVSAFFLYQSKMSLLCRIGSSRAGAKVLANHGVLNRLADCELFSLSNLANCYAYGLDNLYIREDINNNNYNNNSNLMNYSNHMDESITADFNWFHVLCKHLYCLSPLSVSSKNDDNGNNYNIYWDIIELMIIGKGSVESSCQHQELQSDEDELKVTWAAALMPTLRLCKIVLNSLGPTHMSINQQVFNFLYTHSSSLMCNETQLTSSLVTFLSRQDWSYINHNHNTIDDFNNNNNTNNTVSSNSMNSEWLIQWIASETNIINLFTLIMQACNSSLSVSCSDEYSNLQREVIQSKILRHTFDLLVNLIDPNTAYSTVNYASAITAASHYDDDYLSRRSKFQNSCLAFEYLFIETQYIQLMFNLLCVLTSYLSTPEGKIRTIPSEGLNKWSTRTLFQFFNSSPNMSKQDNSSSTDMNSKVLDTLTLFITILKWAMKCLYSKEKICISLMNAQFLNNNNNNKSKRSENQHSDQLKQQFGQSVVQLLNCESSSENLSINDLRQASSIIFNFSAQLFNSNDRTAGGKENQNSEFMMMQRLTQIGASCLRVQLRGLIGIIEQSTFLLWKHLTNFINNHDTKVESIKKDQSLQPQRLRDLSSSFTLSPKAKPSSPAKRQITVGTPAAGTRHEDKSLLQKNIAFLRSHFNHSMLHEMFEMLNHLTKAAFLKQNQRLFIQVMHDRLEKILINMNTNQNIQ